MATMMAAVYDNNKVDGDGTTGDNDGAGTAGDDNDDDDDGDNDDNGDGAMGDSAMGYDYNSDGDGRLQRRRQWQLRDGQQS